MPKDFLIVPLRHQVDRLFDSLIHTAWGGKSGEPCWMPASDVAEEVDRYRIDMDLPGVRHADVSITAEGRTLRVAGHRERLRRDQPEQLLLMERHSGRFVRTFRLPDDAHTQGIRARFDQGVLTIEIPRL